MLALRCSVRGAIGVVDGPSNIREKTLSEIIDPNLAQDYPIFCRMRLR